MQKACEEYERKHGNIDLTLAAWAQGITQEQYDAAWNDWARLVKEAEAQEK